MTKTKYDYSRSNLGPPVAANDNHRPKPRLVRPATESDYIEPEEPDYWSLESLWHRVENGVYSDDE